MRHCVYRTRQSESNGIRRFLGSTPVCGDARAKRDERPCCWSRKVRCEPHHIEARGHRLHAVQQTSTSEERRCGSPEMLIHLWHSCRPIGQGVRFEYLFSLGNSRQLRYSKDAILYSLRATVFHRAVTNTLPARIVAKDMSQQRAVLSVGRRWICVGATGGATLRIHDHTLCLFSIGYVWSSVAGSATILAFNHTRLINGLTGNCASAVANRVSNSLYVQHRPLQVFLARPKVVLSWSSKQGEKGELHSISRSCRHGYRLQTSRQHLATEQQTKHGQ